MEESFLCVRDGERHKPKEVAFNLPDAVFALSRSQAERESLARLENEDTLALGEARFVRGWAGMASAREVGSPEIQRAPVDAVGPRPGAERGP